MKCDRVTEIYVPNIINCKEAIELELCRNTQVVIVGYRRTIHDNLAVFIESFKHEKPVKVFLIN